MKDFNSIYSDSHKIVLGFIQRKVNNLVVAEELANDVFVKVHKHLNNYDETKSAMKTWIMNITSNVVIDYYRKKKLQTISLNKDFDSEEKATTFEDKLVHYGQTPDEVLNSKELSNTIDEAIVDLGTSDFEVAYYFFKEELTYQEISDELNIPLGTVKGKINRARKSLASKLQTQRT